MAIIYLALGSNMGNRQEYLDKAISLLNNRRILIDKISTVIETDAVGGPKQGQYLNAVIRAQTSLTPEEVFIQIQNIEQHLGRLRTVKNAARTIDIDILLYDDVKLISSSLLIPHPRMFERAFVMEPLREIAPNLCKSFEQYHN